jgi:N-acetylmuramoyl-L-alanine amidase
MSTPSSRLRSRLLKAAVRDNAELIAGSLPAPLRPARRLLLLWLRRACTMALPLAALIASVSLAGRSADQAPPQAAGQADDARMAIAALDQADVPPVPVPPRAVAADALALPVRRVVVDPGHGGADAGASGAGGLVEKDVALDIALRVRQLLAERHVDVVLTRTADTTLSLKERAAAANAARGDIFVSIHLNAFEPAPARGVETYYLGAGEGPATDAIAALENAHSGYSLADMRALLDTIYADARRDQSRRLAGAVQRALVTRLRTGDRGLADRGVKTAPFLVLVATDMPAILAEVSFLSNAAEAERLATPAHRQTIAEALASGIRAFIDQTHTYRGERKDRRES